MAVSAGSSSRLGRLAARGLVEIGIEPSRAAELAPQLVDLSVLIARWTRRVDLVAPADPEAVLCGIVLKAAALAPALPLREALVDVGSGAGIPGLPLAILHPEVKVLLIESRERRHHFQREAVRRLRLRNAEPILGRAEKLAPTPQPLVIAAGLGSSAEVLAWLVRWCRPGGWIALPRGANPPAPELEEVAASLGIGAFKLRAYRLPLGGGRRFLWLGRLARGAEGER